MNNGGGKARFSDGALAVPGSQTRRRSRFQPSAIGAHRVPRGAFWSHRTGWGGNRGAARWPAHPTPGRAGSAQGPTRLFVRARAREGRDRRRRWGVGVVAYPPGGKQSRHSALRSALVLGAPSTRIICWNETIYVQWFEPYLQLLAEAQCRPVAVQWLLKD